MSQEQPLQKRILVINGGGFRGLGCLLVIERIVREAAIKSRKPSLLPHQLFDLICGTSSGGLVALLLGRLGLDCGKAIEVYKALGQSLFGDSEKTFWDQLSKGTNLNPGDYEKCLRAHMANDIMEVPSSIYDPVPKPGTSVRLFKFSCLPDGWSGCVSDIYNNWIRRA
jgi:predicted acylesterase/phospholipase RssA